MDLRLVVLAAALATACRASEASRTQDRGSTQSAPPAIVYQDHLNAGGVKPPGATLVNPLAKDPEAAKNGERTFAAMNCDGCHGGGGLGWVGPSLVDGRWRYGGADGEIFHSIFYGRPRGMPGVDQGASPVSWTAWLAELDRQQLALRVSDGTETEYELIERKSLN